MPAFIGELAFLSNFARTDVTDEMDVVYRSIENYYQAQKTVDRDARIYISRLSPGGAIRYAKSPAVIRRPDWQLVKLGVMMRGLRQKFRSRDRHGWSERLIAVDPTLLIEINTWHDTFWGVCECTRHQNAGLNWLGILLTLRQSELLAKGRTHDALPVRPAKVVGT